MRKRTQVFVTFFILIIALGFAFYLGWSQFKVAPGSCGVLVSKTSGVSSTPIMPGKFSWNWEFLLPTNAQLKVFSVEPKTIKKNVSGSLPSSEIYSNQISEKPNFSYDFEYEINLSYTPSKIVSLVKESSLKNNDDLNTLLDTQAQKIASDLTEMIFVELEKDSSIVSNIQSFVDSYVKKTSADYSIVSINAKVNKIPDIKLYRIAKDSFEKYQAEVEKALAEKAATQAADISSYDASMIKLDKLGAILKKYPELVEIFKSTGNVSSILEQVNSIR